MAGYSTLKATATHFAPLAAFLDKVRTDNPDVYGNAATVPDMHYTDAKRLMLTDINVSRGYDPHDSVHIGYVDELSDTQTEFFQQALAYKQLALVFERLDNGQDSLNREKWLYYMDMYERARRSFGSLSLTKQESGRAARSVRISL